MTQVSLYFDERTFKQVKAAAKKSHLSISSWVRRQLEPALLRQRDEWPEEWSNLFGSIDDPSFVRPDQGSLADDIPRLRIDDDRT